MMEANPVIKKVRYDKSKDKAVSIEMAGLTFTENSEVLPVPVPLEINHRATITENGVTILQAPAGKDGFKRATITVDVPDVPAVLEEKTVDITENGTTVITPSSGVEGISKVSITTNVPGVPTYPSLETEKTYIANLENTDILPSDGYNGIQKVTVKSFNALAEWVSGSPEYKVYTLAYYDENSSALRKWSVDNRIYVSESLAQNPEGETYNVGVTMYLKRFSLKLCTNAEVVSVLGNGRASARILVRFDNDPAKEYTFQTNNRCLVYFYIDGTTTLVEPRQGD